MGNVMGRVVMMAAAGVLAASVAGLPGAGAARAQGQGAIVPLPAQMAAAAQQYLPGVVGAPVPAFPIDPKFASIAGGTRTYKIVSGTNAGQTEQHVIAEAARDSSGTKWRYTIGEQTAFLQATPGESLSIVSLQDADQGVLTRYKPAEPLLLAGMNAGDTRTMTIAVTVYDLEDPEDLEYKGTLDLTLTYVGAYQVTVPAGTFDAALLRWEYKGKVGPAKIEDIQARFVAPEVGLVAMAGKRDIAAMLIYNDETKVGKVLVAK